MWSYEGSNLKGPSVWDAIISILASMYIVKMVDIVKVEVDVVRIFIGTVREVDLVTIRDVVTQPRVVQGVSFRLKVHDVLVVSIWLIIRMSLWCHAIIGHSGDMVWIG